MLIPDCSDNTVEELLDLEQEQPSGQRKSARKTKQILKAYRYRLYPNQEQETLLKKHFGCVRHVYNWALGLKIDHYEQTKKSLSLSDIARQLVAKKKNPEFLWLNEVNSQSLQSALRNLDSAFQGFFKHKRGYPKFKSKRNPQQSFQCPQHVTVDFEQEYLNLPKIKEIKTTFHRTFEGEIKTVTIKRTPCGHYYASVLVDETQHSVAPVVQEITPENTLGLDLGLNHFLIDSDGHKIDNPRFLKNSLDRLKAEQKIFARKQENSKARAQQKTKVARLHEKVKNQRKDFNHQRTAELVKKHHTAFVVEDLNIKGMVKNRKLARTINDVGWGQFILFLSYKCERVGKTVHKIGRYEPTSKVCSCCGYKRETMPLSVREWQCPSCQQLHDRDINAGRNIRKIGLADMLGLSICVKSTSEAIVAGATASAKGLQVAEDGSQEAPTRIALAI